jgi:hypothetical protein
MIESQSQDFGNGYFEQTVWCPYSMQNIKRRSSGVEQGSSIPRNRTTSGRSDVIV